MSFSSTIPGLPDYIALTLVPYTITANDQGQILATARTCPAAWRNVSLQAAPGIHLKLEIITRQQRDGKPLSKRFYGDITSPIARAVNALARGKITTFGDLWSIVTDPAEWRGVQLDCQISQRVIPDLMRVLHYTLENPPSQQELAKA